MSKTLAKLINESERDTRAVIEKLEQLSGFSSQDVRLLAKHQQHSLQKVAGLGLDPHDTTAEEFYHVLQVKLAKDAQHLARAVNYQSGNNETRAAKLINLAAAANPHAQAFAIKKTVVKNLLRANPPKRLMKNLNYRSLDSMLKREDLSEVLVVLPVAESQTWQKKFLTQLSGLKASGFETRSVTYHVMSDAKWQKIIQPSHPISYVPLFGAVAVWPVEALNKPESVCLGLMVLQAAEILEVDSLYLKNYQFQPQFGELASRLYASSDQQMLQIEGRQFFDWHSLKHLFSTQADPLKTFSALHPALAWWKDLERNLSFGENVVSAHMGDVLYDLLNNRTFSNRQIHNGISALKSSLLACYLSSGNVANYFRAQLDDTSLALEPVAVEDSISAELEAGLI